MTPLVRTYARALVALSLPIVGCSAEPPATVVGITTAATVDTSADWTSPQSDSNTGVSWADYDGDGDLDMAVSSDSEPNRVYENTGGGLTLDWSAPLTQASYDCAWGDWDNDGDVDLAIANKDVGNRVYANDGAGGLSLAWTSTETDDSRGVAWGDWDDDGDLELAVANASSQANRVYDNTGGALSLSWTQSETARDSYRAAWGDSTGDGLPDLAFANANSQPNRVYASTDGGLALDWTSSLSRDSRDVAWGDYDGDGDLDLAVANHNGLASRVYANDGSGGLVSAWTDDEETDARSIAFGDWDRDGDLDLAIGTESTDHIFINTGSGYSEEASWESDNDSTAAVAWADWDGDGDLELSTTRDGGANRVYENAGDHVPGVASSGSAKAYEAALGDADGDGDLDILVARDNQHTTIYSGDGSWSTIWSDSSNTGGRSAAWGDWDGDGDLDFALGLESQANQVWVNDGTGSFSLGWSATSQASDKSRSVAWGDWDGDGDLDLAVGNHAQPNRVYRNTGSTLTLAWSSSQTDKTWEVAWADVDGDLDLDLVVANEDVSNRLYLGGGGTLTLDWSSTETDDSRGLALGDIDGDGDVDVVFANNDEPNRVYTNSGGSFSLASSTTETTAGRDLCLVDLDFDGDLDAVFGNENDPLHTYLNDGSGGFSLFDSSTVDKKHRAIGCADLDGDGDIDFATGTNNQALYFWENHHVGDDLLPDNPTTATLQTPGTTDPADGISSASAVTGSAVAVSFTLIDAESDAAAGVTLQYSDAVAGGWQTATTSGDTTDLAASPSGTAHSLTWDVAADGVLSDTVTLRLVVEQDTPDLVAGPVQLQMTTSATSMQFRAWECFPLNADGDGFNCDVDCDDTSPLIYPGAAEVVDDGIDQDCNGADTITCYVDADDDGYGTSALTTAPDGLCDDVGESAVAGDCDDTLASVYPGAPEIADDGIDQDCSGTDSITCFANNDGDAYGNGSLISDDEDCADAGEAAVGGDCNDADASIYPGAAEVVDDGIDQDCSGQDSVTCFADGDGDEFGVGTTVSVDEDCTDAGEAPAAGDCNDADASIYPGAPETPDDGIDQDCSGTDSITCFANVDGDAYGSGSTVSADADCLDAGEATVGGDCDDSSASVYPGAPEIVDDGIDQDCSGADSITCFDDGDGDGFGDGTLISPDADCTDAGEAAADGDCNDALVSVYPGAPEIADDGIDQDCSGADTVTCYTDNDGDDWGDGAILATDGDCTDAGEAALDGDCDDDNAAINPDAVEIPADGIDQNCDGVDDGDACFEDLDGDGFGTSATVLSADEDCDDPGESDLATDCDDSSAAINPDASEVPDDSIDQDCSGADTVTCYTDGDGDDFGVGVLLAADGDCNDAGEAAVDGDCDDALPSVYPGAPEIADDGVDQDCDGDDTVTCYTDGDGDGFGSPVTLLSPDGDCTDSGEAATNGDCNDALASAYPGAPEVADDGVDQDCDGNDTVTCFADADGDGFGDGTLLADDGDCGDAGEAVVGGDCDDASASVYPGGLEVLDDGIDQDCDGNDTVTCYLDADGDSYGSLTPLVAADGDCADPGEAATNDDCDDAAASVSPAGTEIPDDGIDQDCSGADSVTCLVDGDGDSFGATSTVVADDGDCDDAGEATASGDCDDAEASVYPGAPEITDDGVDQDCDGSDTVTCYEDLDGDTWGSAVIILGADGECVDAGEASSTGDCDDSLPGIYPGAPEACDSTDSDCNGSVVDGFADADGDLEPDCVDLDDDDDTFDDPDDCGPLDPTVYPGAPEVCDTVDSDCDGDLVDGDVDTDGNGIPDCVDGDSDGDGYDAVDDCDDDDAAINPAAAEIADDDIDQDCNGADTVTCFEDLDGDTWGTANTVLGDDGDCTDAGEAVVDTDCDDADPQAHPGAPEIADDGTDQDCDGNDTVTCFVDADGDGSGGAGQLLASDGDCVDPGEAPAYDDCDVVDPTIYPGASELCDEIDSDCDGDLIDGFPDTDSDGTADCLDADDDGDLFPDTVDCDPLDATVYPLAPESCDEVDSDCDGSIVDDFDDSDGDGIPDCVDEVTDNDLDDDGYDSDVDCDDTDASIHPGATETPDDGIDQDCDGVDETACFTDDDGDDFGADAAAMSVGGVCADGTTEVPGDCDDDDVLVNPGAAEQCNGEDDDCDGVVPAVETDDADADGWTSCLDCDDNDPGVGAGDPEVCADGIDNDCDELTDGDDIDCDGLVDDDGDGWCPDGVDLDGDGACDGEDEPFEEGSGEVGDCDETDDAIHPDAEELCDGVDSDCDPIGLELELDLDDDGAAPCDGDCDDTDPGARPGAAEVCADGVDQDCDGTETDDHDDPECWDAACTDCSSSAAGHAAPTALALLLVAIGFGARARRRRSWLLPLIAVALLLPTVASARDDSPIQEALSAGRCDEAAAAARAALEASPDDAAMYRALGDAERCLGNARPAVLAYLRHLELAGEDATVRALVDNLRGTLGSMLVRIPPSDQPADPLYEVRLEDELLAPAAPGDTGELLYVDLSPATAITLSVDAPGFERTSQNVPPMQAGEHRVVELSARWLGFGQLKLAEGATCQVWAEEDAVTAEPMELTAGQTTLVVQGSNGQVEATVEVAPGGVTTFDPTPWLPAAVRISGLPAGASIRLFVEGPQGRVISRELALDASRGSLHPETGVLIAPPYTIDSLYGGTGGVFVSHPIVGKGVTQVVLEPGALNQATFDWSSLEGVAAVTEAYSQWRASRVQALRSATAPTIAAGLLALGSGVVAGVLGGSAVAAGLEVTEARGDAIAAANSGSPAAVDGLWDDYRAASNRESGLLVGTGILGAVSVAGTSLTITFGVRGRRGLAEVGEWEPRPPGGAP